MSRTTDATHAASLGDFVQRWRLHAGRSFDSNPWSDYLQLSALDALSDGRSVDSLNCSYWTGRTNAGDSALVLLVGGTIDGWGSQREPAEVADSLGLTMDEFESTAVRDLQRGRAFRELGEVECRRAIWNAHRAGLSQRQIAAAVGRSQPDVGRVIKRVEGNEEQTAVGPREVVLRRIVGEITPTEMMARLLTMAHGDGESDPSPIGLGYVRGTWDEVRALRDEGLLTEPEWQELFEAVVGSAAIPEVVLPDEVD